MMRYLCLVSLFFGFVGCEGSVSIADDLTPDERLEEENRGKFGSTDPNNPDRFDPETPEFTTLEEVSTFSRLTKQELRFVVTDLLISLEPAQRTPVFVEINKFNENNYSGFYKNFDPISARPGLELKQLTFAKVLASQFMLTPEYASMCAEDCFENIATQLLPRLWKREISVSDQTELEAFYQSIPEATRNYMLLVRIFASPFFYYKIFRANPVDDAERNLKHGQLVSYLVVGSYPDDELQTAIESGEIVWADQIRRLLDKHPGRFTSLFVTQWLGLGSLFESSETHDEVALRTITYEPAFIMSRMLAQDRPISALIDLDTNFVTATLGGLYGIDTSSLEPGFQAVEITETLFGTAALTYLLTDEETNTPNPIKRGSYVVNHLLCKDLQFPSNDVQGEVDRIVAEAPMGQSPPERMAYFRETNACAGCHIQFDFYGLALEEVGAYGEARDEYYTGDPVVSEGEVNGIEFSNSIDFAEKLARTEEFNTCFATQVYSYATSSNHVKTNQEMKLQADALNRLTAKEIIAMMVLQAIGETP